MLSSIPRKQILCLDGRAPTLYGRTIFVSLAICADPEALSAPSDVTTAENGP